MVLKSLFWLSDEAWAVIAPHLPQNQPGARRVDDRRVISGIVHMLRSGGRWRDCPAEYGPYTTVYNRWSGRRIWGRILDALIAAGRIDEVGQLDSSYVKAHRSAGGAKGGPRRRQSASAAADIPPRSTRSVISSAGRSGSP